MSKQNNTLQLIKEFKQNYDTTFQQKLNSYFVDMNQILSVIDLSDIKEIKKNSKKLKRKTLYKLDSLVDLGESHLMNLINLYPSVMMAQMNIHHT